MTQVTSLSLSRELWEKGLRIETEKWHMIPTEQGEKGRFKNIPAPSTDELLAIVDDTMVHIYLIKRYGIATAQSCLDLVRNIDELGKMILWLLDNGYKYEEKKKWVVT